MTDNSHKAKMQTVKAAVDEKVNKATIERGVVIVLTGDGKGKSSSGFGTLARTLGHGLKAAAVQFIKGKWESGERNFFEVNSDIPVVTMGTGFTWETQDADGDQLAFDKTWEKTLELLKDETLHFLLLDELTFAITYNWITVDAVIDALKSRPEGLSVMITGRNAHPALMDYADTVSEIKLIKHAFESGIQARLGIEW